MKINIKNGEMKVCVIMDSLKRPGKRKEFSEKLLKTLKEAARPVLIFMKCTPVCVERASAVTVG